MKKEIKIKGFLVLLFACICFISCTSSDDEDASPEQNLPEEMRNFIGMWDSGGYGIYIFFSDGVCWAVKKKGGSSVEYTHTEGYWTYDATTKILATSIANQQWQITLSKSDVWTGIPLGRDKSVTFNKGICKGSIVKYILEEQ